MARDSSPFAHRLKALAQRAGLPVERGPAPDTAARAEPPAGESPELSSPAPADAGSTPPALPAAAASGEQPTGETLILPGTQAPGTEPAAAATDGDEAPAKSSLGTRFAALRNLGPKPVAMARPGAPAGAPAPVGAVAPAVPGAAEEPGAPHKPSFAERAALRRRARTLRARRDAGLVELGAIVLDQRRFGDASGGSLVRRRTDELSDLEAELTELEITLDEDRPAEVVATLGLLRCTVCQALLGPRDAFCAHCGTARPVAADGSGDEPAASKPQ